MGSVRKNTATFWRHVEKFFFSGGIELKHWPKMGWYVNSWRSSTESVWKTILFTVTFIYEKTQHKCCSLRYASKWKVCTINAWKVSKYGVFSSPNKGKYGPVIIAKWSITTFYLFFDDSFVNSLLSATYRYFNFIFRSLSWDWDWKIMYQDHAG